MLIAKGLPRWSDLREWLEKYNLSESQIDEAYVFCSSVKCSDCNPGWCYIPRLVKDFDKYTSKLNRLYNYQKEYFETLLKYAKAQDIPIEDVPVNYKLAIPEYDLIYTELGYTDIHLYDFPDIADNNLAFLISDMLENEATIFFCRACCYNSLIPLYWGKTFLELGILEELKSRGYSPGICGLYNTSKNELIRRCIEETEVPKDFERGSYIVIIRYPYRINLSVLYREYEEYAVKKGEWYSLKPYNLKVEIMRCSSLFNYILLKEIPEYVRYADWNYAELIIPAHYTVASMLIMLRWLYKFDLKEALNRLRVCKLKPTRPYGNLDDEVISAFTSKYALYSELTMFDIMRALKRFIVR